MGGRKGIRPVKKEWWVLASLSVWSEVQTCIWPSWCHCHSLSLASVKSRLVLPFWYWLTWVVPEKRPLNGCSSSSSCSYNLQHCQATPRTPLGKLTALAQTSWLDFGERKGSGKGRWTRKLGPEKKGRGEGGRKKRMWKGKRGEEMRRGKGKGGRRKGKKRWKREGRGEFREIVIFP